MKIKNYTIILEQDVNELIDEVKKKIRVGWKPQGGISVSSYEYINERKGYTEVIIYYCQALILSDG